MNVTDARFDYSTGEIVLTVDAVAGIQVGDRIDAKDIVSARRIYDSIDSDTSTPEGPRFDAGKNGVITHDAMETN